jgi:DDE superfamily endonuclease
MPLSFLPALLSTCFRCMDGCLHPRRSVRVSLLCFGILLASERRTVTSWFRAAEITAEFRAAYNTVWSCGRRADWMAVPVLRTVETILPPGRLRLALDDTPTRRWGPEIEGAGLPHNPNPGPAGERFLYGHVWVCLAALARHPERGTVALPLLSELYVRRKDVDAMEADHRVEFRTKLEMAGELLAWVQAWRDKGRYDSVALACDGGYAKRPFLLEAKRLGVVVFSRLPRNAALCDLPQTPPPGRRGRKPIYGKNRISLEEQAEDESGWQRVECTQYGERVTKTVKTFQATWRSARGVIRVVIVKEGNCWIPYFSIDPDATAGEVLEMMADRGSIEGTFKDVKEVWGAGQQQVRNLEANKGCFELNGWMYSQTEVWAWDKPDEELVDRSASPWDGKPRRPSHPDKRKALKREVLRNKFRLALTEPLDPAKIEEVIESLLDMAL